MDYQKRSFLKTVLAGSVGYGALQSTELTSVQMKEVSNLVANGEIQKVYSGESSDQLPIPDQLPAVGITNEGIYYYPLSGSNWIAYNGWFPKLGTTNKPVGEIHAQKIENLADYVVGSVSDLEQAFNNLSNGETVYIGSKNAPYRTTQWLDIDVSNVTIIGPGIKEVIKPADGANVGGIRIGKNTDPSTPIENVSIRGVGFNGNEATMDDATKYLHAFVADSVREVTFEQCYATRTHPFHEHNTGGSGITIHNTCNGFSVRNCWFEDIGDRAVQAAGKNGQITGIYNRNGFNRTVALGVKHPDYVDRGAQNVTISDVLGVDISEGSVVGLSSPNISNVTISNVTASNSLRSVFRTGPTAGPENVTVTGLTIVGGKERLINLQSGTNIHVSDVLAVDNIPGGQQGIFIGEGTTNVSLSDFVVKDARFHGVACSSPNAEIRDGRIQVAPTGTGNGLFIDSDGVRVQNVRVSSPHNDIRIASSSNDVRLDNVEYDDIGDSGTRTRVNGVGIEKGATNTPNANAWDTGDIVEFTSTISDESSGVYLRLRQNSWLRL